jgi:hypothetical protein
MVQRWSSDDANGQQTAATAIAQFRLNDVTTVVMDGDAVFGGPFLQTADNQSYFPEWYVAGTWSLDDTSTPNFFQFSRTQWSHAFGLSSKTMAHLTGDQDAQKAYKSIDPANSSADGGGVFPQLLQIVNGIQMAGPNLTPETFREGLNKMGKRTNDPPWSVGGGYARGDNGYPDDVTEIWWDINAENPNALGDNPGAYRFVDCGKRYKAGQLPTSEPKVFVQEGTCTFARGAA